MCGIWGVVHIADQNLADTAARALYHRGPDDHGTYVSTDPIPVSLVNARLAIIDLSEGGHQPMTTEDGRFWIVYNGEMYNFEMLRDELIQAGHTFRSHSDTEVILHGYEEWGEDCVDRFRGMFAFAIWDTQTGKLFAARDRLGIKPLYYSMRTAADGKTILAFASELKALLATGFAERAVNPIAIHHYLSFYAIPTPYTILQNVEAVPAGHNLTFQNNRLTIREYWNIPTIEPLTQSEDSIREELRELLEESIRLRMIADVPVGAFLSGGLDSSAVVALMTRISGEQLKTFSIGFDQQGTSMDERSAARVIADLYGTDHTEVIVTGSDVCEQIDDIVLGMDQPSGDGLNTYFVSQATAKHVKVALSGLGGDELFAGYPQFKMFQQAERASGVWQRLPAVAQTAARGTAAIADPIQRAVTWLDGDVLDRYERVRVLYDEAEKLALYAPDAAASLGIAERSIDCLRAYVNPNETDPIAQVTRLELKGYMAHTLLRDTDAMSMAHSLEVRVPLIDHVLVEFAARIPASMKLRNGRTKWILAEALRDLIPQEVIDRPKRGFEMPVAAWMRNELRSILEDALSQESVERRGLFRYENVQAIYQNFLNGKGPYMRVWSLVMLELWMRRAIDQPIVY